MVMIFFETPGDVSIRFINKSYLHLNSWTAPRMWLYPGKIVDIPAENNKQLWHVMLWCHQIRFPTLFYLSWLVGYEIIVYLSCIKSRMFIKDLIHYWDRNVTVCFIARLNCRCIWTCLIQLVQQSNVKVASILWLVRYSPGALISISKLFRAHTFRFRPRLTH